MSLEENFEEPLVNYDWDAIILWAKERDKKIKLAQLMGDEDLLEALEEQQIVDEIEIKQEIVLDPNE
jgi:hypothetical protein